MKGHVCVWFSVECGRHTGFHQLLETVLHLPYIKDLDRHHLPLLEGVLLSTLTTTRRLIALIDLNKMIIVTIISLDLKIIEINRVIVLVTSLENQLILQFNLSQVAILV